MTDHLPECPISYKCHGYVNAEQSHAMKMDYCVACKRLCICDALRACEQRVLNDLVPNLHLADTQGYNRGLRAAEAAALSVTREIDKDEMRAAIDALKEKS